MSYAMACARPTVSSVSAPAHAHAPTLAAASANTSSIVYPYVNIAGMKKKYPYKTSLLGWFLDYYRNIVTEDKKNPLFFRTKIYQAFPQNPFHKFKNIKKVGGRWMVGQNNTYKELQSVDMAERDKIHRMIRTKLNQITEINFNQIKEELMQEIMQIEIFELYDILVSEIYEKFLFEKKFQDGYIKLIKQIDKNKDLAKNLVTVSIDENNQFYWFMNTSDSQFNINPNDSFIGPFESEEKVNDSIEKCIQLRIELLGFLHKKFNERGDHIKEIRRISEENENNDETQETIFRIRRNIFGVIEMIGRLYKEGVISINVIHHVLLSLFHFQEYENKKRFVSYIAPEEIEAIIVIWNYIGDDLKNSKNDMERVYYDEYMYLFEQIRKINKDSRIDFLLMDIFENHGGNGEGDNNDENDEDDEDNISDDVKGEVIDDWDSGLNKEETKISKYLNEYLEHQVVERTINQFMKDSINLNIHIQNIILFMLENMDKSRILRILWRVFLSDKLLKIDVLMNEINNMLKKADDWELDIPDFAEKMGTLRSWIA